jgi:hypothetical protein
MNDTTIINPDFQTLDHLKLLVTQGNTVHDLATRGYFKNSKCYPTKSYFKDVVEICKCCGKQDVKLSAEEQAQKAKTIYHNEENRLYKLFKDILFFSYNITPKKGNVIFQLAWEDGHASGYAEVIHYFEKYIDLVNEFNSIKED